VQSIWL
jgi:molecular chaperone DnaK